MFLKRHILLSLLLLSLLIILTLTSLLTSSSPSYRPSSFSSHRPPKASRPNLKVPLGSDEYPNGIVNGNGNANKNKKSKYNPTSWLTLPFLSSTPSSWYPMPQSERFESVVRETAEPLQQHGHGGMEGYAVYEGVYMRDGMFYVVRKGGRGWWGRGDSKVGDMKGMGENLRYITPEQAKTVLGEYVIPIHGTSFIFWDEGGVGMDYYTWWAHLILGSMRVYASLSLIKGQKTPLDEPARFMVPHSPSPSPSQAHISLMRSTFPSSPIEGKEAWTAYKDTGSAYVWERLVLVSPPRNLSAPATSHTLTLTTPPPLPFWSPLQHRTTLNVLGYLPLLTPDGRLVVSSLPREMRGGGWVGDERRRGGSVHVGDSGDGGLEGSRGGGGGGSTVLPLVTLLMPRGAGLGQRLDKTSYDELRVELRRLEWVGVVRFKEVKVDVTGFVNGVGGVREVMRVVGESAVLISTHNPSLINQLWMPSTPRSSIIEIFTPGVYDERYAVLGRNVGHEHYTMWNTTYTADPTALLDGDTLLGEGLGRREDAKPKPQTKEDSKPKEKVDDEPQAPAKPKEKVDEKHIPEPDPKPEVIPQPKPDTNPPPKEPPKASNQDNVDVKASEPPKNTLADSGGVKVSGKAVAQLVRWILTRRMDEEEDVVYR